MNCLDCGVEVEDQPWTRLKNNMGYRCEDCRLAWNKKFLNFLGYWQNKTTSEHGIQLQSRMRRETVKRIDFLEELISKRD